MINALDFLYLTLSLCAIAVTAVVILNGMESFKILKDIRTISENIQEIVNLLRRLARFVVPGAEKVARDVSDVEDRIHGFISHFMPRNSAQSAKKTKKN